jgi:two-component system, NarL family, sensor histidine kinase YdfH
MQPKGQYAGLLFYIFISVLLISLAVSGALAVFPVIPLPLAIVYILLFGAHIGLYWLNLKHHENRRWAVFYYILQAALIILLANFPYNRDSVRISILGSTTMCMIGETLGLWGNTRRSLFLGLFHAGLAVVLLFFTVERNVFGSAISSLLFNAIFIVLFMIVLNQQVAEREKAEELAESLESANARLAANAVKIESLTLQNERQRMARELHDTLAQGVAGLVLQLEAVKAHLASERAERASAIVDQALARARGVLAESRAAIDDLRSGPANLAESVREKVDRFTQGAGIPCELELSVRENQLSTEAADHALNILNEALANVMKHAQATKVHVRFIIHKENLELEVRDDGRGFDVNGQTSAGHYGLLGMRERARLSGGVFTIDSNPQQGTAVCFVFTGGQGKGHSESNPRDDHRRSPDCPRRASSHPRNCRWHRHRRRSLRRCGMSESGP